VSDAQVLTLVSSALAVGARIAAPLLLSALVIGVVVSIFQAITQIQEMTLTFVPKLIGIGLVILVAGNWMIRELVSWVQVLWTAIPSMV
jgi:flagellar biosynthesis protein FliQ